MGCCSLNNYLRGWVFLIFLNLMIVVVKSDDKLMSRLCGKTEEPTICEECLHSDPKGSSADAPGLAVIALECAERDTTQLQEETTNLTKDAIGRLKQALDECSDDSFMAQQDFEPLKRYVREGQYKSAVDVLTAETIPHILTCLKVFDQFPDLPVPSSVIAGTVASNQTSHNAASILANI